MQMAAWLKTLPSRPENFVEAYEEPEWTASLYWDWLENGEQRAVDLLAHLDRLEHMYRETGLSYHKIPHSVRHRPNLSTEQR
jgi:hypothetical protein